MILRMPRTRLHKALAEAGVASRRASEDLITQGRVRVNGDVVKTLPAFVDPAIDRIQVDGEDVARPRKSKSKSPTPSRRAAASAPLGKTTLMLYKPRGIISTTDDPEGRPDVLSLVPTQLLATAAGHRLYPVGRLDADSTGLLLLSNDGELTHRLTHPSFGVTKTYRVAVAGKVDERQLQRLRKGLFLADRAKPGDARKAQPESVQVLKTATDRSLGDRTILIIKLTEGQNREIRRLLARLGFKVRKLHRTAIGPVRLSKLTPGQARALSPTEATQLRKVAGLA